MSFVFRFDKQSVIVDTFDEFETCRTFLKNYSADINLWLINEIHRMICHLGASNFSSIRISRIRYYEKTST